MNSRQTIAKWENGETLPNLETFFNMCKLFKCELGYLLCEYDCKTKAATDIYALTGLSENAINKLITINNTDITEIIATLSKIIEHDEFIRLLRAIHVHVLDFNNNHFRNTSEESEAIARIMNCQGHEARSYMETSSKALIESSTIKIVEDLK